MAAQPSPPTLQPADGRLGVLFPGLGAVATTFIAGVMAVRRKLARPVGSLSQMQPLRLDGAAGGKSPKICDALPLAGLDDLRLRRLGHSRRERIASRASIQSFGRPAG